MNGHDIRSAVPVDISALSIDELDRLIEAAQRRRQELSARQRQEAFQKLERFAKELGIEREAVADHFAPRGKRTGKARYQNPKNPVETWNGRGRKPAWVEAHLEGGGSLDDLRI